jgi:ATP-binding cassette, subfamily C (CFTR/MRP), member 1
LRSGKSSLIATLLRLIEVDSGSIFIDGVDLATVPRDVLRERLATISQDALVLPGTLRFNLDPRLRHPDAAIMAALERVGLRAILFGMGIGLDDTLTAASGIVLSKGQQQLLALARALLANGRLLLLDEPTADVDKQVEAVMQRVITEAFSGRTVLTVAHRVESLLDSDIILVLDQGCLVEVGTPPELLMMDNGWFRDLFTRSDTR